MSENGNSKYILPAVLLVVCLCIASYFYGAKRGTAKNELSAIDRNTAADKARVDSEQGSARQVDARSDAPDSSAQPLYEVEAATPERQVIEAEQKQRLMRNLSDNLAMPGMSRIIRDQQRVLMANQYRPLIETYGLNEKEKEYFLDLLTARQMYHVDMGMKLMTGMLSDEERDEMLKRVGTGINEVNKEIDWFLNNATDSEYFQYYERTEGERAIVDSVSAELNQAGHPLAEGMDKELIAIMHEEISDYPFSVQFEENGEPVFSNFTSANIDTFMREMQELRDPMIQEASTVLTPEQLEVFAGSFDQYVAFYDQRLRMVQQLFNPAQ